MNRFDLDPFLNPNLFIASFSNSFRIYSGTENSILHFLVVFSRGDVSKFLFVISGVGGVPFLDVFLALSFVKSAILIYLSAVAATAFIIF